MIDYEPPYVHGEQGERSAQIIHVETSRMMPIMIVVCVLVGLSLGVSAWALSYADKARMEARILQVKVEGFENALHAQGIDPNPHLKGEPR